LKSDIPRRKKKVLVPIPGSDLTPTAAFLILRFVQNFEIRKEAAVVEGK
jgi:hypothetical protein